MSIIEILKVIVYGLVEGYTEWLPISSTGHLILVEELIPLNQPEQFIEVFRVVIQLGAILAVVVIFWNKLWPFFWAGGRAIGKGDEDAIGPVGVRISTLALWIKIIIACIPAAVVGIPLDDFLDAHLYNAFVVALTLIIYGVIFIWIERRNAGAVFPVDRISRIDIKTALLIGVFQCLSLIPGTSRSGSTIIGAMLLGCARPVAAEFSFFLGIPVMFGASLLKIIKHGLAFTGQQWLILLLGMLISFIVALYAVRFLMDYVRKHDFAVFGYYRIVLGVIVLIYFGISALI